MKATAIFGCPGTGKTTYLASTIGELAVNYPNMAVVSFSKVAAGVLTSRLKNHSIRYIGTLHALAFRALGMTKKGVADDASFAKWYGTDMEEVQQAMSVYRYHYHRKVSLPSAFTIINPVIPFLRIEHLIQSYLNWKSGYQYLDFDDMVRLATGKVEKFDVVVVDEAQDCTDEQWQLVLSMLNPDGRLYMAGDDDQALFTWAGANPHAMDELATDTIILGQSYRIPVKAHQIAEATVKQINKRVQKEYRPTTDIGVVESASYYEPMVYRDKHTILFRDKWAMAEVEEVIIERGIPYTKHGDFGMFERSRCVLAKALILEDYTTVKRMNKYLRSAYRDDPVAACNAGWQKSLDFGVWMRESRYLSLVDPTAEPLIHLSTIHGFKGEEDGHVVVMADCPYRVSLSMDSNEAYDDEVRVWYVALTRCRHRMTIVGWNQFINYPREER